MQQRSVIYYKTVIIHNVAIVQRHLSSSSAVLADCREGDMTYKHGDSWLCSDGCNTWLVFILDFHQLVSITLNASFLS